MQAAPTATSHQLDSAASASPASPATAKEASAAPIPGTTEYYNIEAGQWVQTGEPNIVGNTTGGSWAGVISRFSDAPEATYYLLALMATKEKSTVYAARGWDGVDPGRFSHFLPPDGSGSMENYKKAGWDQGDAKEYTTAYFENFNR